jgi:hypothetical protein
MHDYVRYGFMYGGYLDDPHRLLEGTGKRMRHVKVRSLAAASDRALRGLVEAAWKDGEERLRK